MNEGYLRVVRGHSKQEKREDVIWRGGRTKQVRDEGRVGGAQGQESGAQDKEVEARGCRRGGAQGADEGRGEGRHSEAAEEVEARPGDCREASEGGDGEVELELEDREGGVGRLQAGGRKDLSNPLGLSVSTDSTDSSGFPPHTKKWEGRVEGDEEEEAGGRGGVGHRGRREWQGAWR